MICLRIKYIFECIDMYFNVYPCLRENILNNLSRFRAYAISHKYYISMNLDTFFDCNVR